MIGERFLILITVPMKRFVIRQVRFFLSLLEKKVYFSVLANPPIFSPPEKRYVSMYDTPCITRTGTISLTWLVHLLLDSSSPKRDLVFRSTYDIYQNGQYLVPMSRYYVVHNIQV